MKVVNIIYFLQCLIQTLFNVDGCSAGSEVEAWSSRGDEVVGGVVAEGRDLLFLGTSGIEGLCAGQLASPIVS
ncbi:hypothetical protein CsSME_00031090 [Camellia sinensis var. sinensis]